MWWLCSVCSGIGFSKAGPTPADDVLGNLVLADSSRVPRTTASKNMKIHGNLLGQVKSQVALLPASKIACHVDVC